MESEESKRQRVVRDLLPKVKGLFYVSLVFYLAVSLVRFWKPVWGEEYINTVNLAILVVVLGLVVFGMERKIGGEE